MKCEPLSILGAEVSGLNLEQPLGEVERQSIVDALARYNVLFFRDQSLTGEQLVSLAANFGPAFVQPAWSEKYQDLLIIETDENKPAYLNTFHQDMTGLPEPPAIFFLHALVVPQPGGDTIWSCNQAAYDALSPTMQAWLESLSCRHSLLHYYAPIFARWPHGAEKHAEFEREHPPVSHPMVVRHPGNGRKTLFVNRFFTECVEHLSTGESRALLEFLYRHIEQPEFCVRLRWRERTLAIWDNRATSHYAVADYFPQRRKMQRASVAGGPLSGV